MAATSICVSSHIARPAVCNASSADSASNVLHQLAGGLRAAMGYVGGKDLADYQAKARFIRITSAGLRESHVHDVTIVRESPNYPTRS